MTLPKVLIVLSIVIFSAIALTAFFKKSGGEKQYEIANKFAAPIELEIDLHVEPVNQTAASVAPPQIPSAVLPDAPARSDNQLPHADRIAEFFNRGEPKLPIVETITYRSRVAWQKGRPAWLSDYAAYYSTSRHFIARSLNGKPDYFKQDVAEGDRFNVLRKDKNIVFYLLIDTSRCKMWFYYIDQDTHERVLIKDYVVGLGRKDTSRQSGSLTPLGKYSLGNKIAIYKPKVLGIHGGQKIEMVQVFGSRWIPFEQEISDTTAPAKGLGIHGVPWKPNAKGDAVEERGSIGTYSSDGCIRLATEDMEELFAVIITKPTTIELVKDFFDAKLPGLQKQ